MGKSFAALLLAACICHAAFGQSPAAARRPTAHLVSCIDVKDFGAETVRIGDLDGDGGPGPALRPEPFRLPGRSPA